MHVLYIETYGHTLHFSTNYNTVTEVFSHFMQLFLHLHRERIFTDPRGHMKVSQIF